MLRYFGLYFPASFLVVVLGGLWERSGAQNTQQGSARGRPDLNNMVNTYVSSISDFLIKAAPKAVREALRGLFGLHFGGLGDSLWRLFWMIYFAHVLGWPMIPFPMHSRAFPGIPGHFAGGAVVSRQPVELKLRLAAGTNATISKHAGATSRREVRRIENADARPPHLIVFCVWVAPSGCLVFAVLALGIS